MAVCSGLVCRETATWYTTRGQRGVSSLIKPSQEPHQRHVQPTTTGRPPFNASCQQQHETPVSQLTQIGARFQPRQTMI